MFNEVAYLLSPIYATTTLCWIELFAISIAVYFPLSSVVTLYTLFPNVIVIVAFAIGFLFSSSKYPIIYILSPSFKGGLGIIDNVVFSLRTLNDVFIILGLCVYIHIHPEHQLLFDMFHYLFLF